MRFGKSIATKRSQQGITLVLISLIMLILIGMGAFAMDLNHKVLNKARLQNAVDSAALASAMVADDVEEIDLAASLAEAAAINTLNSFASSSGNHELATEAAGMAGTISITFSNTKEKGTFVTADKFVPDSDGDGDYDIYVRVAVSNINLTQYLSYIFGGDKDVSASAVAGPSAAIAGTCNISPIGMCADPDTTKSAWGYIPSDNPDYNSKEDRDSDTIYVLKPSNHDESGIGAGNYRLLDFGEGKNTVRDLLAGDTEECIKVGDSVDTETGKATGPVAQGLNTRFDKAGGTTDSGEDIKPDKYLEESNVTYDNYKTEYENDTSNAFYYKDYLDALYFCENDGACDDQYYVEDGLKDRRVLSVPIVDCDELPKEDGKMSLTVKGIGCFFITQQVKQKGNESEIFGQFLEDCTVKNASTGIDPSTSNVGPHKIQLYKDPHSGES
ncbi:Tad domain-containing protein [Vibrio sp. YIC-376]|uniref:Tad domain-containing protein n=1 Tax=Vibrio sp. YIC-376 TaxID=3136162 RepID=UPI00402AD91B